MSGKRAFGPGVGLALVGAWLLSAGTVAAYLTSSLWYRPLKDHPALWLPLAGTLALGFVMQLGVGVWVGLRSTRLQRGDRGRMRLRLLGLVTALDALLGGALTGVFGWATHENFARPFTLRGTASEMLLALPPQFSEVLQTAWYVRIGWSSLFLLLTLSTWFLLEERQRARLWVVGDVLVLLGLLVLVERAGSGPLTSVYAIGAAALVFALTSLALRTSDDVRALAARSATGIALVGVIIWSFFHRPLPSSDALLVLGVSRLGTGTWALARCVARVTQPLLGVVENLDFRALVAARHLRAKKSGFLAFIATLSIMAVTLSTCMLCVVLSVMGGFRKDLKDKILGNHAHVVVDVAQGTFTGWRETLAAIDARPLGDSHVPGVVAATPYVQGEVMIGSTSSREGVVIRGIDTASICNVTSLCQNMSAERGRGSLRYLNHPEELLDLPAEERGTVLPMNMRGNADFDDEVDEGVMADLQELLREDLERAADQSEGDDDLLGRARGPAPEPTRRPPSQGNAVVEAVDPTAPGNADHGAEGEPAQGDVGPASPEERAAARVIEALRELNDAQAEEQHDAADGAVEPPGGRSDSSARWASRRGARDKDEDDPSTSPILAPSQQVLPGIVVGRELARSLRLFVGDDVDVISPFGELGPTGPLPKARRFRVAGIFYSGMYEYDMKLVYVTLEAAQAFLATEDTVTGIEIKLEDQRVDDAPAVAAAIRTAIDRRDLRVEDWQQRNRNLFGALALEKLAMFLVLGIAILIAGFCVFGTLTLMVQEKAREVGILMAMGTTRGDIVRVFLLEGLFIGLFGAAMGLGLGFDLSFGAEHFGIRMNPEVYYIDRLPVHTDPAEFALVGLAAVAICTLATIFPAIVASRTSPLEALRHE
ncbi:MAG: FtsX-like permease family protein [Sandaracinaceae bacterium]|nr:FtsX-like permease family protein [Sandaracinaceae bacterium]